MTLNNLCRRAVIALLSSTLSVAALAKNTDPADCAEGIVQGTQNFRASHTLTSGYPSVTGELDFPLPYVLSNLGLSHWTPGAWKTVGRMHSHPKVVHLAGLTADQARQLLSVPAPEEGTAFLTLGEGRSGLLPLALQ